MAKKTGLAWAVLGTLAVGLLLVAGCQDGAVTEPGPAVSDPAPAPVETVAVPAAPRGEVEAVEGAGASVELALRFTPGRTSTYRVTTETEKSVTWEGNTARKPAAFKSGRTGNHVEITFDQHVERIGDQGDAVIEVTIKALKYLGEVRGNFVLDFDSTRPEDRESPLALLIGQSYRLELTPKGAVAAISDAEPVRAALEGDLPEHGTALKLVSDRAIRERHEIPALMSLEAETVRLQEKWSNTATFSFGRMGVKAYERIYTLEQVEPHDGRRVAVVAMNAIPSAVAAEALREGQVTNLSTGMFDNTDRYEGRLRLDLSAGEVAARFERLQNQWVTADPAALQSGDTNPAVLKMGAVELYQLERLE